MASRENHNIEHVFPGVLDDEDTRLRIAETVPKRSPFFNQMEADLHNLYPTRDEVNSRRGSLPFGEIEGEDHDFPRLRLRGRELGG